MKKFRESENIELKKVAEDLINKWKLIIHKPEVPKKEVEADKPKINIEDYLINDEDKSSKKRNNTRKNLYKYLEPNLKDKDNINRVLEIMRNLKDEKNDSFRNNIINGSIKPEDLCTMEVTDMLDKKKQEELENEKKKKVEEISSDWIEKHGQITEGVYKCRNCGGKKTVQKELQTRSADEPMTIFITCVNCKNTWKI